MWNPERQHAYVIFRIYIHMTYALCWVLLCVKLFYYSSPIYVFGWRIYRHWLTMPNVHSSRICLWTRKSRAQSHCALTLSTQCIQTRWPNREASSPTGNPYTPRNAAGYYWTASNEHSTRTKHRTQDGITLLYTDSIYIMLWMRAFIRIDSKAIYLRHYLRYFTLTVV